MAVWLSHLPGILPEVVPKLRGEVSCSLVVSMFIVPGLPWVQYFRGYTGAAYRYTHPKKAVHISACIIQVAI